MLIRYLITGEKHSKWRVAEMVKNFGKNRYWLSQAVNIDDINDS